MKGMTDNEKFLLEKLGNENIESLTKRGRKAELEKYCSWIGVPKSGSAKEKASRLLYWYDSKTYKDRLEKYENLKLKIDVKPGLFHGKTVRKNISQNLWLKKIRLEILSRYDFKCSICGYKPVESERKQLHVHEIESYDIENVLCELKELELICRSCHSFHHIARTYSIATKAQMEELISHFTKINEIERDEYHEYFRLLQHAWRYESMERTDNKINSNVKYNPHKKVRFKISFDIPYRDQVIDQLQKVTEALDIKKHHSCLC